MSKVNCNLSHGYFLTHRFAPGTLFYVISSLLLIMLLIIGCAKQNEATIDMYTDVTAEEAFKLIQANEGNPDFIILDVRTAQEFNEGHIANALMINFNSESFKEEINKLDKDKTYLVYCRTGNRSRGAVELMTELGFTKIYHLTSGIVGWLEAGLPVTK